MVTGQTPVVKHVTSAALLLAATTAAAAQGPEPGGDDAALRMGLADCRLAAARQDAGDTPEAARLAAAGLAALEHDAAAGDPDLVDCAAVLARAATAMGDHRTAWRAAETVHAGAVARHGESSVEAGATLGKVAQSAADAGEYDEAAAAFERALAILSAALGPDRLEVAEVVNSLANLARRRGDYVEARQLLERALAIFERELGPDDPRVAGSLNNLGNVQAALGDFPAAEATYRRALGIWERTLGPEAPTVAKVLSNLGAVILNANDPERAVPLLERSVAIRERAFGVDAPVLGIPLINLGDAYLRTGDLERARATLERAISIFEQDRADSTYLTEAVNNLGLLLLGQGRGDEAAAAFERARRAVEATAGHDHPRTAIVIANQARAAARRGRLAEAVGHALESERVAREHLLLSATGLSEREALTFAFQQRESLGLALSLVLEPGLDDPGLVTAAWDALIRSRGLVLEEMALRRAMLAGHPEAGAAVEAWRRTAAELSQALLEGAGTGSTERIDRARHGHEAAERALGALVPSFDLELAFSEQGFQEVSEALPEGACLVAFSRFDRSFSTDPARRTEDLETWYLAFVRSPSGAVTALPLAEAATVDRTVADWRAAVAGPGGDDAVAAAAGDRLRRAVWDPAAARCAGARRVLVVPDGELTLVKLGALPDGPASFLVETAPPLAVLGHERDLIEAPTERRSGPCLLAVGAPDYGAATSKARDAGGPSTAAWPPFPPLPGSDAETAAAVELWTRSRADRTAVRLTGAEATEAAFKALAPDFRVVHLATHGFVLDGAAEGASAGGRGVGGLVVAEPAPDPSGVPSPHLSGLVFAGANRRGDGSGDGILTAEEIATLDLDGVEWVVLSACESGVGKVASQEGVLGLQRAFRTAGVRTVVTSLWVVDDEAAREWMTSFYRARLAEGLATADAVHRADLEVLTARRTRGASVHPAHWAAFQATGDWR
jgi:CHAT domain-containing protein/tetratricopeptide (TPR) repeat protein